MPQKYKVLPGKKPIAPPQSGEGTGSIPASGSALVEKLRTALVALLVSDRNTAVLSDEEILGIMTSKDAKEVPILMERASAIYKARLAVVSANSFLKQNT